MTNKEAAQIIRTSVLYEDGKSKCSDQDIKIALEIAAELLDNHPEHKIINREEYKKLERVGILNTSVRGYNRGNSDYRTTRRSSTSAKSVSDRLTAKTNRSKLCRLHRII